MCYIILTPIILFSDLVSMNMIYTLNDGVCGDRGTVDFFTFNTKLSNMSDTANQRILHPQKSCFQCGLNLMITGERI